MEQAFRLFDFHIYNDNNNEVQSDDSDDGPRKDTGEFKIQMFGINEKGESCSILVNNYQPFFYVKVGEDWTESTKVAFLTFLRQKVGKYYEDSIVKCQLIKRKKLYEFDAGKEHAFLHLVFQNIPCFNKVKNLWYNKDRKLLPNGFLFRGARLYLYEANIPPLLRFFHIKDISPSGWVALPKKRTIQINFDKKTNCTYEFCIDYRHILPLNEKETMVPYKICSFDIEASSSHGDFPVPVKSYKKLATNLVEYWETLEKLPTLEESQELLRNILLHVFGFGVSGVKNVSWATIDRVFPKIQPTIQEVRQKTEQFLCSPIGDLKPVDETTNNQVTVEELFERQLLAEEDSVLDAEGWAGGSSRNKNGNLVYQTQTIVEVFLNKQVEREIKLLELRKALDAVFPKLEGDKVTFIGSTFLHAGEPEPYLNHCVVLNSCGKVPVENAAIESYSTEDQVLLAWKNLIQRENPDIIIGYNIFGFDYDFMFHRAEEMGCLREFLQLSRNRGEICANLDTTTNTYRLEETKIVIASGEHNLRYIKMTGRIQIDLYNYFRREENLTSYKLDYVAGHFIGDYVKKMESAESEEQQQTLVQSSNLTGLQVGSYIHIEEIGHSTDYYSNGDKFLVTSVNKTSGQFCVTGKLEPDFTKKVRWCLAKDDVTPKDIFRMTNGTAEDRAVIAKYCIQDCNLVHYLMNKVDVLTGFVEMSKICSVPISFLVLRGQGIKLTSYVAKKCREKNTLMPVVEKMEGDDGYEGAIVLDPKCDLYLDNPVACVDYASLYPSSMISENLSHDSKVWTREYDLEGNLIKETGEKDAAGNFLYDNLPDYEYVNITYDTFTYVRARPTAAAEKVKSGYKICRFAQFPQGRRAIMPSILEELLAARKATRKLIPLQTDEFMKNVLDKRQLGYKVTANSLYGQCGARTSSFYEKDVAASTTATGRMLLTYAKRIIEETYGDTVCETSQGPVRSKAEYIYGDTDSVFFTFNLQTLEGQPIRGKQALEITIELAKQAGHLASSFLKKPHDLEYEKTFMPFCLLSKKRYVGMLYEEDPNKGKRKEMGIVLKRRDNAPIVKDIYGGIIDILMKQQDIQKAMEFLQNCLKNIVEEKYPIEKLIITKSLRSGYKNPKQIAHKVLADRMTARDPGNKPGPGDRIPFVYIHTANKKALQGDKIETPTYIRENNIKIDYSFYITNQIMKPVQQVFALVLEKIWTMKNKKAKLVKFRREVEQLRNTVAPNKWEDKLEALKNKEIKTLLFDDFLRSTNNQKTGNQDVSQFFRNA